jgi:hypothetical protein
VQEQLEILKMCIYWKTPKLVITNGQNKEKSFILPSDFPRYEKHLDSRFWERESYCETKEEYWAHLC